MKNSALSKVDRGVLIGAGVVVLLIVLMIVVPESWTLMLNKMVIMALFATSMNVLLGYGGMMPMGHAIFLGIGGYAYTILVSRAGMPILPSILLALVIVFLASLFIGYFCLKGSGMTFAFLSMGFSTLLYTLIVKWKLAGAEVGLTGAARPAFASTAAGFGIFTVVIVAVCFLVLYVFMHSAFAKVVCGLRDNTERLSFLGINTHRFSFYVFVIGAFFAGVAGILYAMLNYGAYPATLNMATSTQGLMMCVLGGATAFLGPTLGAVIITLAVTQLSNVTVYWQALLGIIIIPTVLFFRGGILGTRYSFLNKKQDGKNAEVTNG